MEIVGYMAIFCVGFLLGLVGGGGSILAVPILIYIFSIDVISATSYSLFLVGITCAVGTFLKSKEHFVDVGSGILFGIPSILAVFFSRIYLIPSMPDTLFSPGPFVISKRMLILGIITLMIISTSIGLLIKKGDQQQRIGKASPGWLIVLGILIGIVTGIAGIGGGFIIVPVLFLLARLPFQKAVGTSLLIIGCKSFFGFVGDLFHSSPDWWFLLYLSIISIAGIIVGDKISNHVNVMRLKRTFAIFLLIVGILVIIKEVRFH